MVVPVATWVKSSCHHQAPAVPPGTRQPKGRPRRAEPRPWGTNHQRPANNTQVRTETFVVKATHGAWSFSEKFSEPCPSGQRRNTVTSEMGRLCCYKRGSWPGGLPPTLPKASLCAQTLGGQRLNALCLFALAGPLLLSPSRESLQPATSLQALSATLRQEAGTWCQAQEETLEATGPSSQKEGTTSLQGSPEAALLTAPAALDPAGPWQHAPPHQTALPRPRPVAPWSSLSVPQHTHSLRFQAQDLCCPPLQLRGSRARHEAGQRRLRKERPGGAGQASPHFFPASGCQELQEHSRPLPCD